MTEAKLTVQEKHSMKIMKLELVISILLAAFRAPPDVQEGLLKKAEKLLSEGG